MIPRWHILYGLIFTIALWFAVPKIPALYLALVFLSSFLIDFDHYAAYVIKKNDMNLKKSFDYHDKMLRIEMAEIKRGIKKKSDFHLFHTIEFHILIGIIAIFSAPFFYIFIGMVFHSLLDLIFMASYGAVHRREFFLLNWLNKNV